MCGSSHLWIPLLEIEKGPGRQERQHANLLPLPSHRPEHGASTDLDARRGDPVLKTYEIIALRSGVPVGRWTYNSYLEAAVNTRNIRDAYGGTIDVVRMDRGDGKKWTAMLRYQRNPGGDHWESVVPF